MILDIMKMCNDCDMLLVGSAHDRYFHQRLKMGKPTIKCSERYFKNDQKLADLPKNIICALRHIRRYQKYPLYYLCASAYTKSDINKFASYEGRAFKWGYFPKTQGEQSACDLINEKKENSLLWVARFLDWKHPEIALYVADRLRREGYRFNVEMVGTGPMYEEIKERIISEGLSDYVAATGPVPSAEVLLKMQKAQILLFTSDCREGWGAVLNEAMGNCCAAVASRDAGSTPYLIKDGENGFSYSTPEELYGKVKKLMDDAVLRERMAVSAYDTIADMWNPEVAARRLVVLCRAILSGEGLDLFSEGPCSRA